MVQQHNNKTIRKNQLNSDLNLEIDRVLKKTLIFFKTMNMKSYLNYGSVMVVGIRHKKEAVSQRSRAGTIVINTNPESSPSHQVMF